MRRALLLEAEVLLSDRISVASHELEAVAWLGIEGERSQERSFALKSLNK